VVVAVVVLVVVPAFFLLGALELLVWRRRFPFVVVAVEVAVGVVVLVELGDSSLLLESAESDRVTRDWWLAVAVVGGAPVVAVEAPVLLFNIRLSSLPVLIDEGEAVDIWEEPLVEASDVGNTPWRSSFVGA
jgi:hypothetical protein